MKNFNLLFSKKIEKIKKRPIKKKVFNRKKEMKLMIPVEIFLNYPPSELDTTEIPHKEI